MAQDNYIGCKLRVEHVEDNKDGTFTFFVEARPMTPKEREVLHALFPDFPGRVEELVQKQALMFALVE